MPSSKDNEPAEEFLDPIPEDVSVVGESPRRMQSLSSVISTKSLDMKSDTGVLLGGEEGTPASEKHNQVHHREEREKSSLFKSCSRRLQFFSVMTFLLGIAIVVAIYFIVEASEGGSDDDIPRAPTSPPTPLDFSDFFPPSGSGTPGQIAPTPAPTYSTEDMQVIDGVLSRLVFGTNDANDANDTEVDIYNSSTPHGACRSWLTEKDRLDIVGSNSRTSEGRIQQRYTLCLLFKQMNGKNWSSIDTFMDTSIHECLWDGITCDRTGNFVVVIDLAERGLMGRLPVELENLQRLVQLRLSGNSITGTIPSKLLYLPNLEKLDLSVNQLSGTISSTSSSPLEIIKLSENKLEGTVPFFPKVEKLWVATNSFSAIDESYTRSPIIESIRAFDNKLDGEFPQDWDVPKLEVLDLAFNEISGTLPQSILRKAPKLEALLLDSNKLEGPLPSWSQSTSLQDLWLDTNELTGTIPSSFGREWKGMKSLFIHDNKLQGSIDRQHCERWPESVVVEADCALPSLSCYCCTMCHG
eukprot:scaffold2535_cov126-Cylindrotheca_fusiformis.AAC.12